MTHFSIDPDIKKSGVAMFTDGAKTIFSESLDFTNLVTLVTEIKTKDEVEVLIEAGWANASYFHLSPKDTRHVIARKGYNVGENHRTGKLIAEFIRAKGIKVTEVRPLKKIWRSRDGKITHDELVIHAKQHGLELTKKRTNQDERDAVLLGLVHFDLK